MSKSDGMGTRVQSAADAIRRMILDGELRRGTRLQAQVFADRLGISRTPVYDALSVLHKEGLLEYGPNKGYSIRQFDIKDVMGAFDVRLTLEGLACRIAAEQGVKDATARAMHANLADTEALLFGSEWTPSEQEGWRLLNLSFHNMILEAVDNTYLTQAVLNARSLPPIHDAPEHQVGKDNLWPLLDRPFGQQAFRDHGRILGLIEARQGARAESMMREHIAANRDKTRHILENLAAADTGKRPGKATLKRQPSASARLVTKEA